jgi:hypothetical protein
MITSLFTCPPVHYGHCYLLTTRPPIKVCVSWSHCWFAGLAGQEVHPNSPDLSDAAVDGNS